MGQTTAGRCSRGPMVVWKFSEEIHRDEAQVLGSVGIGKGQEPICQFKDSFFQHLAESRANGPVTTL